jgi:hypothetical protein
MLIFTFLQNRKMVESYWFGQIGIFHLCPEIEQLHNFLTLQDILKLVSKINACPLFINNIVLAPCPTTNCT